MYKNGLSGKNNQNTNGGRIMKKIVRTAIVVLSVIIVLLTSVYAEKVISTGVTDNGLTYSVIDSENENTVFSARITGYATKPSKTLYMPPEINGYPVKYIQAGAFSDCDTLTDVYFLGNAPDSGYTRGFAVFNESVKIHYNQLFSESWVINEPANWNGNTLVMWMTGDVNNDGEVNSTDGALLARYIAGYNETINIFAADVDFDGEITPRDSMILARRISTWSGYEKLPYYDKNLKYDSNDDGTCSVGLDVSIVTTESTYNIPIINLNGEVVTSIANYGFQNNKYLTSITIPDSITSIGVYAFNGCTNLISISIPNSVQVLGEGAFFKCENLEKITIPGNVTEISNYVFARCESLSSITIPETVTVIGDYAFLGCTCLSSITIPNSVKQINRYAFWICTNLSSINLQENLECIGNNAFEGCSSLRNITIPESVKSIETYAFKDCTGLNNITLPENITFIANGLFAGTGLKSITIPDKVNGIGDYAFYGCTSLSSITIPKSLKAIYFNAFENCNRLKTVYYRGTLLDWMQINSGENRSLGLPDDVDVIFNYTGD